MDPTQIVQVFLFGLFGALTAILAAVTGPTYDNLLVPELGGSALFPAVPPVAGAPATFVTQASQFSGYLLVHLVDPSIAVVALGVGLLYFVRAVWARLGPRFDQLLPRLVVAVVLANFALPVAGGILATAGIAYPVIARFDGGSWQHWVNIVGWGELSFSWDNGLLAFVLSVVLFSLVMILTLLIAFRDALLGVLLVLLPILTLLWPLPTLAPLARRAWLLFAELCFLPCVVVIPLELAVGVPNILLAVGYLTVAASAPSLVSLAGTHLSNLGFPSAGAAVSGGVQRGLSLAALGAGSFARPVATPRRFLSAGAAAGGAVRAVASAPFPAAIPLVAADLLGRGAAHLIHRLPQAATRFRTQRDHFRAFRQIPRTCGWRHV